MKRTRRPLSLVDFVRIVGRRFAEERCPQIASSLTYATLLAIVPIDRIEAILDAMSRARWAGRVGRGRALLRDAAEVSIADIYHQFVFRAAPALPRGSRGRTLTSWPWSLRGDRGQPSALA